MEALRQALNSLPEGNAASLAFYYHDTVLACMEQLRAPADALEALVSSDCWPYPTYVDLLFSE